jgi:hypothetical protein
MKPENLLYSGLDPPHWHAASQIKNKKSLGSKYESVGPLEHISFLSGLMLE